MWTVSHRTPLLAWVWWNFHFLCTSSPPPDFCLRTTLESHSHSSWCSQRQRLTLDLASLFGLCQKKTLSNLMTLFRITQSHFCICTSVGFHQFVCICGVQYVLICWRCSHLYIGVGRTRDGWANRRERGKGTLRNVACSAFSFVCMKQTSNYRDICMTLHDQQLLGYILLHDIRHLRLRTKVGKTFLVYNVLNSGLFVRSFSSSSYIIVTHPPSLTRVPLVDTSLCYQSEDSHWAVGRTNALQLKPGCAQRHMTQYRSQAGRPEGLHAKRKTGR